jgi:hypothetical protein
LGERAIANYKQLAIDLRKNMFDFGEIFLSHPGKKKKHKKHSRDGNEESVASASQSDSSDTEDERTQGDVDHIRALQAEVRAMRAAKRELQLLAKQQQQQQQQQQLVASSSPSSPRVSKGLLSPGVLVMDDDNGSRCRQCERECVKCTGFGDFWSSYVASLYCRLG